ncbi:serine hydrolase domain-containing protein [Paenibacillus sedimenti]|uniref:Serine hydrolase n=1 Tax=Paenibacillus sedimenti TaxID=2770274 RepID=A0A926KN30_9BACL|nr:serine hydrolase [Paenibacillus sedimenti]MBD0380869.1 serine hydrolase [Paenibacillus sedimenti]
MNRNTTNEVVRISTVKGKPGPYWPTEGWHTTTPEAQGMDSDQLADTIDIFRDRHVHSMVIIRNGYLVAEAYNADNEADKPQDTRSVTKGITSVLTGIALSEQKLKSVDQRLSEFFPELAKVPLKYEIAIKHLLYMTSGVEWPDEYGQSSQEMMYSANWVQTILDKPAANKPGTRFNYSNGDAHLMSAVLHKATGESLFDYAKKRLFTPLGITRTNWNHDPQGYSIGSWALALTARDMVKIGLLYMKEGEWDGQQIIPKRWIQETLTKRIIHNYKNGEQGGYGYYWWLKTISRGRFDGDTKKYEMFYAAGSGGRRIFVVPELKLIVAMTAHSSDVDMPEQLLQSVVRSIRSAHPLPENTDACERLHQAVLTFKAIN